MHATGYRYNLGQAFRDTAQAYASRPAVIGGEETLTYAALDARSDAWVAMLDAHGVAAGSVVCIAGIKQPAAVAAAIGCVKAGVAYSFFDPASPAERLRKIFRQCAPSLVVAPNDTAAELGGLGYPTLTLGNAAAAMATTVAPLDDRRLARATGSHVAYVMFTSGSTGFPKGAAITHRNVLNLIAWSQNTYGITPADVLTNVNPLYFDNSVFDLYSSLFTGAALALFDDDTVRNPARLLEAIDRTGCTSWFSVPSLLIYLLTMRALRPEAFASVRRIIFGGEGFPKAKLKQIYDTYRSRIAFYNVYGPTECTCICSSYTVSDADFADLNGFLPLGHLIPNFGHLVVDGDLRPLAAGETGELVLTGPNVGLGYYNDPERTAVGFVQHPSHMRYRDIVYRTGDLVREDPGSGHLFIMGRADNQIKHMGYRIELEEIENALSQVDGVEQAGVIHCEVKGFSRIVAFLHASDARLDEAAVRRQVGQIIPAYMVPTDIVFGAHLPKNPNGKLDRKELKRQYLEHIGHG